MVCTDSSVFPQVVSKLPVIEFIKDPKLPATKPFKKTGILSLDTGLFNKLYLYLCLTCIGASQQCFQSGHREHSSSIRFQWKELDIFVVESTGLIHTVTVVMVQCRQATSVLQHSSVYLQCSNPRRCLVPSSLEKLVPFLAGYASVNCPTYIAVPSGDSMVCNLSSPPNVRENPSSEVLPCARSAGGYCS